MCESSRQSGLGLRAREGAPWSLESLEVHSRFKVVLAGSFGEGLLSLCTVWCGFLWPRVVRWTKSFYADTENGEKSNNPGGGAFSVNTALEAGVELVYTSSYTAICSVQP